jgi:hypothetical protein
LIGRLSGRSGFARLESGLAPRNLRSSIVALSKDTARVEAARKQLIESGLKPELVKDFPSIQVVLLAQKRDFEIRRDEEMKLLGLAPWEIDAGGRSERTPNLFAEMLPRVRELRLERAGIECRIAILRHVEALRHHAAENAGELPASFVAVTLPLPRDPISDQSFDYKLDRGTARLRTPSRREGPVPAFVAAIEITIRK